jgi:hypothetical protein
MSTTAVDNSDEQQKLADPVFDAISKLGTTSLNESLNKLKNINNTNLELTTNNDLNDKIKRFDKIFNNKSLGTKRPSMSRPILFEIFELYGRSEKNVEIFVKSRTKRKVDNDSSTATKVSKPRKGHDV